MGEPQQKKPAALILAAGKGTRMESDLPKVLHPLGGRPLLAHVVAAAQEVEAQRIVVVIGYRGEEVRAAFDGQGLIFVDQTPQLGTGHAVLVAAAAFADFTGPVLILCGDVPLIRSDTLRQLLAHHRDRQAVVTLLTARLADPGGYGRVLKDETGSLTGIVEEKDATPEEKRIDEINTGTYCVESDFLFSAVAGLGRANRQQEYYLTDIVAMGHRRGLRMSSFIAGDPDEMMGINSQAQLRRAEELLTGRTGRWG